MGLSTMLGNRICQVLSCIHLKFINYMLDVNFQQEMQICHAYELSMDGFSLAESKNSFWTSLLSKI